MTDTARVIGVPMDLGADRRGVDMGPSAIRYAGLAEHVDATGFTSLDGGDVPVPRPEESDPESAAPAEGHAKFLGATETVCRRVAERVEATLDACELPLVLGGDHSIAMGTIAGSADRGDLGVVWFDAHGDFNTPLTTPSGNVHGMSLAAVLGIGDFAPWARAPHVAPENVALVGLRDLDDGERRLLGESDVHAFTMSDIDARGAPAVVEEALATATEGTDGLHVSLDLDWLDPGEAPGVGTPVRGGVSYREAHSAMERVAGHLDQLRSLEAVEVNPILDEHNRTAELACELIASALGQRVL
ncbi:MAG: arginase [Haloarculaceae archaeon]